MGKRPTFKLVIRKKCLRQEDWLALFSLGASHSRFAGPVALLRSRTSAHGLIRYAHPCGVDLRSIHLRFGT